VIGDSAIVFLGYDRALNRRLLAVRKSHLREPHDAVHAMPELTAA